MPKNCGSVCISFIFSQVVAPKLDVLSQGTKLKFFRNHLLVTIEKIALTKANLIAKICFQNTLCDTLCLPQILCKVLQVVLS